MQKSGSRSWPTALLAGMLLLGACGNGAGDGDGDGDLPALPVGGAAAGGSAAMSAEVGADDASAPDRAMLAPARPVEYRLKDGAKAPATSAMAYRLVPSGDDVPAKVAEVLGADESEVQVSGVTWFFSRADADQTVSSEAPEGCVRSPDGTTSCLEGAPTTTVPGVPSETEARARAKEILEKLGASSDGDVEVHGEDGVARSALFTPEVGGLPIHGLQTQITFGREGRVEFAFGLLATVEEVGDYPLIGLDAALERLEQGFFGGVAATSGAAAEDAPAVADDPGSGGRGVSGSTGSAGAGGAEVPPDPGTTEPGTDPDCAADGPCLVAPSPPADEPMTTIEPVPTEPEIVEVTGADLVLLAVGGMCPDDPVYLVPAFELLPGPVSTVPAVEDDHLADPTGGDEPVEPCEGQTGVEEPVGKPEPAPLPPERGQEPAKR